MRWLPESPSAQWRLFGGVWVVVAILAAGLAGEWARRDERTAAAHRAETAAALHGAVLRSELERQRAVPLVLAQDPDLKALLADPRADRIDLLNRKFEGLAREIRAAAVYVLDAQGVAVAASNWSQPTSFVGSNYRFRPYFLDAVRQGQAAFFALGTVSGRPGLYLSRRVDAPGGRLLGVIVAKVEFDALERDWAASGEPTYVTDGDGVVLITTVPDWRFHTTRPLTPERRRRLATEQTAGARLLTDLPFDADDRGFVRIAAPAAPADLYAHATDQEAGMGWTLHLLSPAGAAIARAVAVARMVAVLAVALLAGLTGILLRRRQRAAVEAVAAEAARAELERQIEARTGELRTANVKLNHEIEERRRLEKSRQTLQDELIQANKLATLGQIAAGVAHEINQPVAAIRTYADSAGLHLARGDADGAERSLGQIGGLVQRIGTITDELRAFARKTRSETVAVNVEAAIDGALLLVGARLRERGVRFERRKGPDDLQVRAERNRLEQVVLNLLQNAIEALSSTPHPALLLTVEEQGRKVAITLADNGPGVSPAVRDRLFIPFTTDKVDGMGLGLVISRDIVAGFGGELLHEPSDGGAVFKIVLAKAR
jgi:two-component system C4-dicarboxylate transport sensor histidine kinase DctB